MALSITTRARIALAQTYLFATAYFRGYRRLGSAGIPGGLAAYLLFGPAKGPEEPLSLRPPSPPAFPRSHPRRAASRWLSRCSSECRPASG